MNDLTKEISADDLLGIEKPMMEKQDPDGPEVEPEQIGYPKTEKQKEKEAEKLKAINYDQSKRIKSLERQLEVAREGPQRKEGITVVNEEGDYERKKRPNTSFGLTDLMLPPYTKKQVAIYQSITKDEINPATGMKVDPVDIAIPGRYTLYDRFERDPMRKDKVIENVSGTERYVEDGEQKTRQIIEDIILERGWKHVPVEAKYPLYVFMELHPMNRSNKWAPKNTPKVFERVDLKFRSPAAESAQLDLVVDAAVIIKNMNKEDIIKYAVPALIPTTNRQIHEIRTDLTRWAMGNPIGFFKLNKNESAGIRINVIDAMNMGLLEYRHEQKAYYLTTTEEKYHVHTAGEDPTDSIVKALMKNDKLYEVLTNQLNYWSND